MEKKTDGKAGWRAAAEDSPGGRHWEGWEGWELTGNGGDF